MRRAFVVLTALLAAAFVTPARLEARWTPPAALVRSAVHELGQSYLYLRVYEDSMVVRVEITAADVENALGFGWDPKTLTAADVQAREAQIRAYVEPRMVVATDDGPLPLRYVGTALSRLPIANYVLLTYALDAPPPAEVSFGLSVLFEVEPLHRNMVVIEHNWRTGTFNAEANVALIFTPDTGPLTLDLTTGSTLRGFIALVWLGVWHILIGTDHILFLVALMLPAVLVRSEQGWKPVAGFREALLNIVMIVSFFTIAHSITLSLAALDVVNLSSRVVESIIAGSIAVAALANLMPRLRVREWSIAFLFGLFHGFGFASVMGDIGLGREHMVLSLLGFNVGVELGQLAIVCVTFPILFALRNTRWYPIILRVGSVFLIAVALVWLYERAFNADIWLTEVLLAPFRWLTGLVSG